jgi:hypothetical protein
MVATFVVEDEIRNHWGEFFQERRKHDDGLPGLVERGATQVRNLTFMH